MAGRYEQLDSDEQRLPEGMTRVGYDADSQQYTYRDADGSYWYGEEGNRYGRLHQSAEIARQSGFNGEGVPAHIRHADYAAMAPWFLIVIVTLMVVFWRYVLEHRRRAWDNGGSVDDRKSEDELQSPFTRANDLFAGLRRSQWLEIPKNPAGRGKLDTPEHHVEVRR